MSHLHKFVFISNHKCGTTSIRSVLDNFSEIYDSRTYIRAIVKTVLIKRGLGGLSQLDFVFSLKSLLYSGSDLAKNPYHPHQNARRLYEHFKKLGWDWGKYYTFTTIRNPWDRVVSIYHYGLKNKYSAWSSLASAMSFENFVKNHDVQKMLYIYNLDTVAYRDGNCLVDKIIKLESLGEELPLVFEKIKIEPLSAAT